MTSDGEGQNGQWKKQRGRSAKKCKMMQVLPREKATEEHVGGCRWNQQVSGGWQARPLGEEEGRIRIFYCEFIDGFVVQTRVDGSWVVNMVGEKEDMVRGNNIWCVRYVCMDFRRNVRGVSLSMVRCAII